MRLGSLIAPPLVEWARADAAAAAQRVGALFEHADVLLTPMFTRRPIPIGTYDGRGPLWSFNGYSRWVPYCAAFNHTGQPGASVPMGFTPDDGFPLAVQLVGRPDDEATLLSLAAQIEQKPSGGPTGCRKSRHDRARRARRADRARCRRPAA